MVSNRQAAKNREGRQVFLGGALGGQTRADFVAGRRLIVELKAVEQLAPVHLAQLIAYLRAFQHPLGLLITFNVRLLRDGVRRVVLSHF
jgi:GxxExxY protein